MEIEILTLFPEYFTSPLACSLLKKAQDKGVLQVRCTDIRDFAEDAHQTVDDRPYGGGPGMVLKPEPVVKAIRSLRKENTKVIYFSPQGTLLQAKKCQEIARSDQHVILLTGHYEGIDQRIIDLLVDEEISVGDYVLMSGMPAALVYLEAVSRFIPGVLGNEESVFSDSFHTNEIFEGPQYTRPSIFEGLEVPEVLLNGNHHKIQEWKKNQAIHKRQDVRPDLVANS